MNVLCLCEVIKGWFWNLWIQAVCKVQGSDSWQLVSCFPQHVGLVSLLWWSGIFFFRVGGGLHGIWKRKKDKSLSSCFTPVYLRFVLKRLENINIELVCPVLFLHALAGYILLDILFLVLLKAFSGYLYPLVNCVELGGFQFELVWAQLCRLGLD